MMNNKTEKVDLIMGMASGRPFRLAPSRENQEFVLIDKDKKLFKNTHTGEEITWLDIQERYVIDPNKVLTFCSISDNEGDECWYTKIYLLPHTDSRVIFLDRSITYSEEIVFSIEEYIKQMEAHVED